MCGQGCVENSRELVGGEILEEKRKQDTAVYGRKCTMWTNVHGHLSMLSHVTAEHVCC